METGTITFDLADITHGQGNCNVLLAGRSKTFLRLLKNTRALGLTAPVSPNTSSQSLTHHLLG